MFTFIYPPDFFKPRTVDEQFLEESLWLKEMGHKITVLNIKNPEIAGDTCILRGWMMSEQEYDDATTFVESHGAKLLTSKEDYFHAHYLPNWYQELKDFTPETLVIKNDNLNKIKEIAFNSGWSEFFVKDYVKSLTTARGSVASSLDELMEVIHGLDEHRTIEGGICLRKVHSFVLSSEIRYFCLNGVVFSPENEIPELVLKVAEHISLPFFSIDAIKDENGNEWLVEIGDGQVSEFKSPWNKSSVQKMFS